MTEKSPVFYENYIQEEQLDDEPSVETAAASSAIASTSESKDDTTETNRAAAVIKSILKRAHPKKIEAVKPEVATEPTADISPKKTKCCHPFVDKLKTMADKQLNKVSAQHKRFIKKIPLSADEKLVFPPEEKQEILKLKESPKAERKEIASYIVKQDSDDVLEIVELEESPSGVRKRNDTDLTNGDDENLSSIVIPDEIIDLPNAATEEIIVQTNANTVSGEPVDTESKPIEANKSNPPPPKAPRKKKEHVYEDIEDEQSLLEAISQGMHDPVVSDFLGNVSLCKEDEKVANTLSKTDTELDNRIDSNLLQAIPSIDSTSSDDERRSSSGALLAPLSSMDSTSSDDERRIPLPALQEESDQGCSDIDDKSIVKMNLLSGSNKKSAISPSNESNETADESHREDVELPENLQVHSRWSKMRLV